MTLRHAAIVLALAGVAVAGYLTYVHYAGIEPVCTGGGGCERVQTSTYSELVGVPVALLGLLAYATLLGALAVDGELGRLVAATTALIGLGFSAYLQYRSLVTLDATCIWCLVSAALMACLAVLTATRLVRAPA
jgi:uncharacterized membrane protein